MKCYSSAWGCIIEYQGTYYWYGEHKGQDNCPNTTRVDVIGVSCYSSQDLINWKYGGLVLEADKENMTVSWTDEWNGI